MNDAADKTHGPATRAAISKVQSFAAVVIVSAQWRIVAMSPNAKTMLGCDPKASVGARIEDVFAPRTAHRMRSRAQVLSEFDPIVHIANCPFPDHEHGLHASVAMSNGAFTFAFEPVIDTDLPTTDVEQVQRLINRVARKSTLADAAREAARGLRALMVVDRVTLHPVRAGRIWPAIGQAAGYPLDKNVPRGVLQALSELDARWTQIVPDIEDTLQELDNLTDQISADALARASCRALSPDVANVLTAEGVRSAHMVPVLQHGRLWGVFLCHDSFAKMPGFDLRRIMNVYAAFLGHTLTSIAAQETAQVQTRAAVFRDQFLDRLDAGTPFETAFGDMSMELADIIPCDGVALWRGDVFHSYAAGITETALAPLLQEKSMLLSGEVFHVARLTELGITDPARDPDMTGALVVPMSGHARDMALFFRNVQPDQDLTTLWGASDLAAGEILRSGFLEAQMRLNSDPEAHGSAELMPGDGPDIELGGRIRRLIDLLQTAVPEHAAIKNQRAQQIDDRIAQFVAAYRGAKTHPAQPGWLRAQVEEFVSRAAPGAASKLSVTEPATAVTLAPPKRAALLLILRALVESAARSGTLGGADAQLTLALEPEGADKVVVRWNDPGAQNPPDPVLDALDTLLIERGAQTLAHGATHVERGDDGLAVTVILPLGSERPTSALGLEGIGNLNLPLAGRRALVLEDNLIAAMDAADQLGTLGAAQVQTCNSVKQAMQFLDRAEVDFALLDVDLGTGTSQSLAEHLVAQNMPVALVTGYGVDSIVLRDFPTMPVLLKPYTRRDLALVIERAFAQAG